MKLGIALSGGGIRGIAHAGVLQALEENGIKPDVIGGTSCGSLIASMYAIGYSPYHIFILFKRYAKAIAKTNAIPIISGINSCIFKKTPVISGLNNGEKIEDLVNHMANQRKIYNVNEIEMPIVIPTVDMISGKEFIITNCNSKNEMKEKEYINDMSIGRAVRASSSFPAYFSPCMHKDYAFMDGGALNNVPVEDVRNLGADVVIAVKFHADSVDQNSNIMDIVMKSVDIMGNKISENSLNTSDYILDVYTDKVGLLDIKKLDKCYEYGYQAVMENLENIKNILR